jgi:hypothetical protein
LGGSTFTIDGNNINGFAEKPLKEYEAILKNGVLIIKI